MSVPTAERDERAERKTKEYFTNTKGYKEEIILLKMSMVNARFMLGVQVVGRGNPPTLLA